MSNKKYAPRIPFSPDKNGNIASISNILENVNQNLRMVILTNPGEKIMDPNFGVGLYQFLFESGNKKVIYNNLYQRIGAEDLESMIKSKIRSQITKYLPDVIINKISIERNDNSLSIGLYYTYKDIVASNYSIQIGG